MELFATCPKGFEMLLADELASLGARRVRPLKGQVTFGTDRLEEAYRACLWSRLASRVVLLLARGPAANSDELYDTVARVAWEEHLPRHATFSIDAHGTNASLRNTQFVALRAKDAITDRLVSCTGTRPQTDTERPDLVVSCRLSREHVSVGIDLTGEPLFRRGYETARGRRSPIAPLRPDYAAALLAAGGWYRNCRHDEPTLVSLFSGAGTVAAEAAAEAFDRAPGLLRARWGFEGWAGHDAAAWHDLATEAQERAEEASQRPVAVLATDVRAGADAALRQTLHAAGMHFAPTYLSPAKLAKALPPRAEEALFVADLSWLGPEDLAAEADALADVRAASRGIRTWDSLVAVSRDGLVDGALGAPAAEVIPIYLGRDEAGIRLFDPGDLSPEGAEVTLANGSSVSVFLSQSEQFARRLAKVAKQRAKWARRELVSCYRVYDSDLPDYAVSIDLFAEEEGPGRWLSVSEYAAPKEIDPALAQERLMDVLALAPQVLGVRPEDVYLHVRTRARGGSQYADEAKDALSRPGAHGRRAAGPALPPGAHLIEEGGLTFEVNFSARLDCGIFLDHRETRSMVREMAKGLRGSKRFLNLFAYTGTATCYAADGGARHTTSVDLSRPSLEWARRNMERNGFAGPEHEYVQADVLAWVREQRHTRNRWDLIFCDVPTFSNSSRMHGDSWDVQRDHVELLIGVSRLLVRGGTCVFSCNLRNFRPDVEALAHAGVSIEDITAQTIPADFSRNPRVHHCYLVRRVPTSTIGV